MSSVASRPPLAPSVRQALASFTARVRAEFGPRVREIRLFGSYARGEGTPTSDVDVAVVIDELTSAEARSIAHVAGDVLTEESVLISPLALSTERMAQLRSRERLIAQDIAREGIPL